MTERRTRGSLGPVIRGAILIATGVLHLSLVGGAALASDTTEVSRQRAKTLVDEGVQLYEQGKYQEALDRSDRRMRSTTATRSTSTSAKP